MALWPFGKKKDTDASATQKTENKDAEKIAKLDDQHEVDTDAVIEKPEDATAPEEQDQPSTSEENAPPVREHDAVNGQIGPYDGDQVSVESFDFSDFSDGMLNLGSIQVAMPKEAQVQVEMGEDGSAMVSTSFADFLAVNEALTAAGFKGEEAEVAMIPSTMAPITDLDTAKKVLKLIDMLEDLDDVQNVYHNAEISDEIMEQLD